MNTTPEIVELKTAGSDSRAVATFKTKLLREAVPPQQGGELVKQIECGNAVVRIYNHSDDPNFKGTVSFARKAGDGTLQESARISGMDIDDLVRALRAARTEVFRGITPEMWGKLSDGRWQAQQEAERRRSDTAKRQRS